MPIEDLFTTRIGSHIWKMDHAGSDIDLFKIYVASTEDILKGTADTSSKFVHGTETDCHTHEVGTLIYQLLKGNVNFVIGVMSPWVETNNFPSELSNLKQLTEKNVGKSIYHSIKGMTSANYKKYISSGKDVSLKKCATILRTLEFGIRYLETGKFEFKAVEGSTPQDIFDNIELLEKAYLNSKLPLAPVEVPFRDWLLNIRMVEWKRNV